MALIVIEGLDGSGKGTQAKLLYDYALSRGCARQVTFPDYDSPSSSLVKMYLKGDFGKEAGDVNAYAASAFYAVDRFASYRMKWKDDYASGVPIISDRYVTSNIVYQLSKLPKTEWKAFVSWLQVPEGHRPAERCRAPGSAGLHVRPAQRAVRQRSGVHPVAIRPRGPDR